MNFSLPDNRRALRSIIEAVVVLALLALLYWLTHLLRANPPGLITIARGALIIVGLGTLFYGAENVSRAIKISGPAGIGAEFGPDAPAAAQAVAAVAQDKADSISDAVKP